MWKSKSDKGFLEYLKENKKLYLVIIVALVSLMLIFLGGSDVKEERAATEEERAAKMCSMIDGVGECQVMMTFREEKTDSPYAVLVLCKNASLPSVREKITSLFTSLYGIGAHRVEIQELGDR